MEEEKYFKFKKIVENSFEENEENLIRFGLNILNLRRSWKIRLKKMRKI